MKAFRHSAHVWHTFPMHGNVNAVPIASIEDSGLMTVAHMPKETTVTLAVAILMNGCKWASLARHVGFT